MRGPADEEITAQYGPLAAEPSVEGGEPAPRRPPGGKALLRLLHLLESAGYADLALATTHAAVSEEVREEFWAHAARFTAAPSGEPPPATLTLSTEEVADAGAAEAERIAHAYVAASRSLMALTPTAPQWRSIGPWTIPDGQTYGSSRVNVCGRVQCVAVDPGDPAHVLLGAANGGVWESHDRGASWAPRTDYAPTLAVGALAFDPSNPSLVYCGTGEGEAFYFLGAGILRSTDGGTTWSTLCTAPFEGQGFFDLVVDPANASHLLAGTNLGLYTSTDSGVTWTRRRFRRTWSLSMAPDGGPAAEILAACSDGLWRSTDGGTTWSSVALPGSPSSYNRFAAAIAPSDPAVAYAWSAGLPMVYDPRIRADVPTAYLWRRFGGTWTLVATGVAGTGNPPNIYTHQAWYDWFLGVAPDNDKQVYCGSIEVHRGDLSGSTWTWQRISNKGVSGDSIHPDQHAIAFEPGQPDTIYVGNDGGLYQSPDRGITWQARNDGLVISEFEYLAQDHGSSRWLIGGTQDNGTQRWTGSQIWEHVADGDGGDCGVERSDPRTVYHTYYGMSPYRSTSRGDPASWSRIAPPLQSGEGSLFYPPFECSATGGDTVAIGGDTLYVSRTSGSAWTRLAFPSSARSSALYIPNADRVFVGTKDGRVYTTSWTGANWSALVALTSPRGSTSASAYVSDLYVDPDDLARMWATYSGGGGGRVFRSEDGGSTWTDCTAGLPDLPIRAIEVDPLDSNRIWVAADLGVYESRDGGNSWADFSNGLPHMLVGDLLLHPHARVLRAGTRNRGIWEIPVDGWLEEPICGVQRTGSLNSNETRTWVTDGWPATWHIVWTVMPTTPRTGDPQLSWDVQVERANAEYVTYWITVRNLTPDPLEYEGRYAILSKY